jgi:lysophospholipase L1-like esterase
MHGRRSLSLTLGLVTTLAAGVVAQRATDAVPPDRPAPRADANSALAHQQLLEKARSGRIALYFAGDSITRRWGATDYPEFLAHWRQSFHGWHAANFGWGGDTTQNILWRLENGELEGVNPKVIVLLAGTNNVGTSMPAGGDDRKAADIAGGIAAIVRAMQVRAPKATIVLMAMFPRNDNIAVMSTIGKINRTLAGLADGKRVRFLDINHRLADADGRLRPGVSADGLHLTLDGYRVWADALTPVLTELLGPRAADDLAPPPTGDPSARAK